VIYQENGNHNQAEVVVLIFDKVHFKTKQVKREKEGHYILTHQIYIYTSIYTHTHTYIHTHIHIYV
jgi:hypothetical protein